MGEYRRWISYVYGYSKGVKGHSAGYVKIECRNGQCKIYTNIKAPYFTADALKIFVFFRENEEMVLVGLGDGSMKKGQCEFTYETMDENIAGSNMRLEQLGGLVAIVDENKFFGTVWDDKEINLNSARLFRDIQPANTEAIWAQAEGMQEEEIQVERANMAQAESEEKESEVEVKEIKEEEATEKECEEKEAVVEYYVGQREEKTDPIERIFARYPGMYPFEDDEIVECVKLEPQDIGAFPMEKWVLANNSFLLHGYYTYRHLIFAKTRDEEEKNKYILGVPGLYRDRERFMAGMFGFDNFKGVRGSERDYGEFGYWYMCLDL